MTRFVSIFLLVLFCLLPVSAASADRARLLVLGDSLSAAYGIPAEAGWVSLLQKRLDDKSGDWEVINASITGDTTGGGLQRLPAALQRHEPEVVVIELGGNDGLRGLSLDVMRRNLEQMTRLAREKGAQVLLLGVRLPANYGPRYAERFHRVFSEVAKDAKVPLVDFFLEGVAEDLNLMQADGIHPSAAAQARVLDNVWPRLEALLNRHSATSHASK